MNIFDQIDIDLGITPEPAATPELGFFNEFTLGKYPKIYNVQHWLKHQLFVYTSLLENNWIMTKPSGVSRQQVSLKEVTRAVLAYYFQMAYLPRFVNERAKEQGKLVDLEKFLDLVMEHPSIQKLIANPHELV